MTSASAPPGSSDNPPSPEPSAQRPAPQALALPTFSPSEVAQLLNLPAATIRSWQRRGLIPADPQKLTRQHRYLSTIDVFYLAVLSRMLAANVGSARAAAIALAAVYGEGKPTGTEGWIDLDPPSRARIRVCQRDGSHLAAHVRHRDETTPYWLLYEQERPRERQEVASVQAAAAAAPTAVAVLPWSVSEQYAGEHRHFSCLNFTALLARIERSLIALSRQRR